MLSASSLRAESSKIRRGLVADSVRTARGRLRYSVAVLVFIGCSPLSGWALEELSGRHGPSASSKSWLTGLRQFRLRFFCCLCCGVFDCGEDYGGSLLDHF